MSLFDEIRKNVTDLTENVAKKSSTVIETQKMRMRKSSLESDLRDYYVQLGKLYEKKLTKSEETDEEAASALEKIAEAKKEIRSIQEALIKARGMVHCTTCGQDVSREFDFCPKCGAKLEKPEPEPEKEVISPDDVTVEGEGESKATAEAAADAQDCEAADASDPAEPAGENADASEPAEPGEAGGASEPAEPGENADATAGAADDIFKD